MFAYPIGWIGWKLAYKLGIPLSYSYDVYYDSTCENGLPPLYIGHCVNKGLTGIFCQAENTELLQEYIEEWVTDFVKELLNTKEHINLQGNIIKLGAVA